MEQRSIHRAKSRPARAANGEALGPPFSEILGPPPLLEGEDPVAYNSLRLGMHSVVKPSDVLEEMWGGDLTDITWEIIRLRRYKQKLVHEWSPGALRGLLEKVQSTADRDEFDRVSERAGIDPKPSIEGMLEQSSKHYEFIEKKSDARTRLVEGWSRGDSAAVKRVNEILASTGLDRETVYAETLVAHLDTRERIDYLIMRAEVRRKRRRSRV